MTSLMDQLIEIAKQYKGHTVDLDVAHDDTCPTLQSNDSGQCNCSPTVRVTQVRKGAHASQDPNIETKIMKWKPYLN